MRKLLLVLGMIVLTLGTKGSFAAEISGRLAGGVVVTLYDTPCTNKTVLALIRPERQALYQSGKAVFPDRTFGLCWRLNGSVILIADEEGDTGAVPVSAFMQPGESGI